MDSKLILFACSNENQVRIFEPVARAFERRGCRILFISFDSYYAQKASSLLNNLGLEFLELPSIDRVSQWWSLSVQEQLPYLQRAFAEVERLFTTQKPSVAIVGNDYGVLEQMFIRMAEAYNCRTVRIQDGIQTFERFAVGQQMSPVLLGDGGCELYCLWSDALVDNARARGIGASFCASSNPRYDSLYGWQRERSKKDRIKVLVATQCFSKYNEMTLGAEVSMYERIIRQLFVRHDVDCILKLHPQSNTAECYENLVEEFGSSKLNILSQGDSIEVLKQIDAVIAVSSTICVESLAMNIPSRRLLSWMDKSSKAQQRFIKKDNEFRAQIAALDFPCSLTLEEGSREDFMREFLNPIDGKASERVVDAVFELSNACRTQTAVISDEPEFSIILESAEWKNATVIYSLLRQLNTSFEILAADRSESGIAAKQIQTSIVDTRLQMLHLPKYSQSASILEMINKCKGKTILRLDTNVIALPGLLNSAKEGFELNPEAKILFFSYSQRNSFGHAVQHCFIPNGLSLRQIMSSALAVNLTKVYAVRNNRDSFTACLQNNVDNPDLFLLGGIIDSLDSVGVYEVPEGVRYLL